MYVQPELITRARLRQFSFCPHFSAYEFIWEDERLFLQPEYYLLIAIFLFIAILFFIYRYKVVKALILTNSVSRMRSIRWNQNQYLSQSQRPKPAFSRFRIKSSLNILTNFSIGKAIKVFVVPTPIHVRRTRVNGMKVTEHKLIATSFLATQLANKMQRYK